MPPEVRNHPYLLEAIETMECYLSGEVDDEKREDVAEKGYELFQVEQGHYDDWNNDHWKVNNNPLSVMAGAAYSMLSDGFDSFGFTFDGGDMALLMLETGCGFLEARNRVCGT